MPEVKWIKITTGMFEDEKIDFIESLPEADSILIIWIKLLSQAGKCNSNGFIFLTENIPYTEEMLAHKFRRPLNVVKMALTTFKNLGMIDMDQNGFLKVVNWEKHQNIDGLEKIREQARLRKQKQREREQKLLESKPMSRDSHVTVPEEVTPCHATEEDKELDKELDILNISLEIKNFRERYSEEQLKVIDNYFDILRWTRKHGKIADSVIIKIYKEWEKFHPVVVIYALEIYVDNPKYHDKKENYCYGIMRNTSVGEVESKKQNKDNVKSFSNQQTNKKKTGFHLSKSRGDKYSADELEELILKNQKARREGT